VSVRHTPGPLIFERHGAFRSCIAGEDWPLGYISEGPGKPIFALHEVLSNRSVKSLIAFALVAAAAPDLLAALQWALNELNGRTRYDEDVADQQIENCYALANAAIAKATGQ
jgi:hypothetical protein